MAKKPEANPRAKPGDNSVAADKLRTCIDRIERLESERTEISDAIKDVYGELKAAGYTVKAVRQIVRERRADASELEEYLTILNVYRRALGLGDLDI